MRNLFSLLISLHLILTFASDTHFAASQVPDRCSEVIGISLESTVIQSAVYCDDKVYSLPSIQRKAYPRLECHTEGYICPSTINANTTPADVCYGYRPSSSYIPELFDVKRLAEDYTGINMTRAVIAVPHSASDTDRRLTEYAGSPFGLEVYRTIRFPIATALAYDPYKKDSLEDYKLLVIEIGPQFIDLDLFVLDEGVFDDLARTSFLPTSAILFNDQGLSSPLSLKSILCAAPGYLTANDGDLSLAGTTCPTADHTPHQSDAVSLVGMIADEIALSAEKVLSSKNYTKDDVDEVVLGGEFSTISGMREGLQHHFDRVRLSYHHGATAAARGAAEQGSFYSTEDTILGRSCGCAAGIVTLTQGIRTAKDAIFKMVARNSIAHLTKTHIFSVYQLPHSIDLNGNIVVSVDLYQGERVMANDYYHITTVNLTIPSKSSGPPPKVEVSISITGIHENITLAARALPDGPLTSTSVDFGLQVNQSMIEAAITQAEMTAPLDEPLYRRHMAIFNLWGLVSELEERAVDGVRLDEDVVDMIQRTRQWLESFSERMTADSLESLLLDLRASAHAQFGVAL